MDTVTRGVAAFDFDGTLVSGDSFPWFLSRVLGRRRFALALLRAAPAMSFDFGRRGRDGSKVALLRYAVTGLPLVEVERAGEAFARVLAIRVRPRMAKALNWHRAQGHERILVSASLAVYLEPFGRLLGFDQVIATRLEVDGSGLLTGGLDGPNVRAAEKARRLHDAIGPAPAEIWAYGNSAGDREMLAMADHPTWAGTRHR